MPYVLCVRSDEIRVILASAVSSQYVRQTDNISWQLPNFAMLLQRSAKNESRFILAKALISTFS